MEVSKKLSARTSVLRESVEHDVDLDSSTGWLALASGCVTLGGGESLNVSIPNTF